MVIVGSVGSELGVACHREKSIEVPSGESLAVHTDAVRSNGPPPYTGTVLANRKALNAETVVTLCLALCADAALTEGIALHGDTTRPMRQAVDGGRPYTT